MSFKTLITVKLTPKSSKNAVLGWIDDEDGKPILKAGVTAVPEKGKANAALIKLLSKHFRMPKGAFTIIKGETSPIKTIEVQGAISIGENN